MLGIKKLLGEKHIILEEDGEVFLTEWPTLKDIHIGRVDGGMN